MFAQPIALMIGSALSYLLCFQCSINNCLFIASCYWLFCNDPDLLDFAFTLFNRSASAAGIALINSIGNLGGFVGPFSVGYVKDATGSFLPGLQILSLYMIAAAGAAFWISRQTKRCRRRLCRVNLFPLKVKHTPVSKGCRSVFYLRGQLVRTYY